VTLGAPAGAAVPAAVSAPVLGVDSVAYGCDISFFVPALNEEDLIVPSLETLLRAVSRFHFTYEIVVVDDGSTDATAARVAAFAAAHPGVALRLIRNPKNRGLGRNYVDAAFVATGRYYKLVCADNPEPEAAMAALFAHLGEADIIMPYLRADPRHWKRKYLSILFTWIVNLVSGRRLRYYNGTAIHLRYNVMRWHSDTYGFAYNAEILTRLLNEGASYVEVPIDVIEADGRISRAFSFHNILSVPHSLLQIFLRRLRQILFHV
jgi:glycosyltransferase involved in cell wall biosynthesis